MKELTGRTLKRTINPGDMFFWPIYAYVTAFGGLNSYVRPDNPMQYKPGDGVGFQSRLDEEMSFDLFDLQANYRESEQARREINTSLCGSLIITAYAIAENEKDQSPIFELFRHMRNAAAHGNSFSFRRNEPSRPAHWQTLAIDHNLKGDDNPLQGSALLHDFISGGDVIYFLIAIQDHVEALK